MALAWVDPFSALRYLDLSAIYDQYGPLIDFFVYLVILVGLAQVVLQHRFSGRGSKAVISGIGTALAAGLALSEARIEFDLRSLGPIAGFIVVALVALILYKLFRAFEWGVIPASAASLVVMYIGVQVATPGVGTWISQNIPLLNWGASIALLYLIYLAFSYLASHIPGTGLSDGMAALGNKWMANLGKERNAIAGLDPLARSEQSESKATEARLEEILKNMNNPAAQSGVIAAIRGEVQRGKDREMVIRQKLDYVETINRKLMSLDLGLFHEAKAKYDAMPPATQARVRKVIQRERLKLYEENRVAALTSTATSEVSTFESSLQMTEQCFARGDIERARGWLIKAIQADKKIAYAFRGLQQA